MIFFCTWKYPILLTFSRYPSITLIVWREAHLIIQEIYANVGAQNQILEIGSLKYKQALFVKLAFFSCYRNSVVERDVRT